MSKSKTESFEDNLRNAILENNESLLTECIIFFLRKNVKNWYNQDEKKKSFSQSISFLQKLIFEEDVLTEHLKKNIRSIFLIEKVMKNFINGNLKDKFIPSDYFKLINSLFNLCKTLDSEKSKNSLKKYLNYSKKIHLNLFLNF